MPGVIGRRVCSVHGWRWTLTGRCPRCDLERWAVRNAPTPGYVVPLRPGARYWLASVVLNGWKPVARHLRARWQGWTVLPGDYLYDPQRMAQGVVVAVPYPGRAIVRWATAEAFARAPVGVDPLEDGEQGPVHRVVADASWPGGYRMTSRLEREVEAWWFPRGRRYRARLPAWA